MNRQVVPALLVVALTPIKDMVLSVPVRCNSLIVFRLTILLRRSIPMMDLTSIMVDRVRYIPAAARMAAIIVLAMAVSGRLGLPPRTRSIPIVKALATTAGFLIQGRLLLFLLIGFNRPA